MSEVERDLELVFDVIPIKEELESKLLAEKQYVHVTMARRESTKGTLQQSTFK